MITVNDIKTYDANLARFNQILDNLKKEYGYQKIIHAKSNKTPLELLVKVHNDREYFYTRTPELKTSYDQALQALVDLVNNEAI